MNLERENKKIDKLIDNINLLSNRYVVESEDRVNNIIRKMLGAVDKIKTEVGNFIKKIVNFVREKFLNRKSQDKLKKAAEIASKDPNLKNKKIKIKDPEAIKKAGDEAHSKFSKLKAKLKSGNISPEKAEQESDKIKEEVKHKISGKKVATITISVTSLLMILFGLSKHFSNQKTAETYVNFSSANSVGKYKEYKFTTKNISPQESVNLIKAVQKIEVDGIQVSRQIAREVDSLLVQFWNGKFSVRINSKSELDALKVYTKDRSKIDPEFAKNNKRMISIINNSSLPDRDPSDRCSELSLGSTYDNSRNARDMKKFTNNKIRIIKKDTINKELYSLGYSDPSRVREEYKDKFNWYKSEISGKKSKMNKEIHKADPTAYTASSYAGAKNNYEGLRKDYMKNVAKYIHYKKMHQNNAKND